MHIFDTYRLSAGTFELPKTPPIIQENFFPLPSDKYLLFSTQKKFQSRDYDHWDKVLFFLDPILKKNSITPVQVGIKDDPQIAGCVDLRGQTTINQLSYLTKYSIGAVCIDSFLAHLAGAYNKPLVILYSNMYKENSKPIWMDENKTVFIEVDYADIKPSFSSHDEPKRINEIEPEKIAQKTCEVLGLFNTLNKAKSLYKGEQSHLNILDIVPNFKMQINQNIAGFNLRYDQDGVDFDLIRYYSQFKHGIISNKKIDIDLLKINRQNRIGLVLEVEDEKITPDYIDELFENSISHEVRVGKKHLQHFRQNLLHLWIPELTKPERPSIMLENAKFLTRRIVMSQGKQYPSLAHAAQDRQDQYIIDNQRFWNDLNFFYIYQDLN